MHKTLVMAAALLGCSGGLTTTSTRPSRALRLPIAERARPDSVTEIEFRYGGVPNLPSDSINSLRPEWVELGQLGS